MTKNGAGVAYDKDGGDDGEYNEEKEIEVGRGDKWAEMVCLCNKAGDRKHPLSLDVLHLEKILTMM